MTYSWNGNAALVGHQRSDVNDLATSSRVGVCCSCGLGLLSRDATPALEHMPAHIPAKGEAGVKVDLQNLIPVLVREVLGRRATLDTAAVDEDIDGLAHAALGFW
jgi:hypothetical protein